MSSALRLVCLLVLLPLAAPAQRTGPDRMPVVPPRPDSLHAWLRRPGVADTTRVKLLIMGSQLFLSSRLDSARWYGEQAVALARRRRFGWGESYGLLTLAAMQYYGADYPAAQASFEGALRALGPQAKPDVVGHAYLGLGNVATELHNAAAAQRYFAQAQHLYARCRPRFVTGEQLVLHNRANGYLDAHAPALARSLVQQGLALLRRYPKAGRLAKFELLLGAVQEQQGHPDSAAATWQQAVRRSRATRDVEAEGAAWQHLAAQAQRRHAAPLALARARQAAALFHRLGDPEQEAEALDVQAAALAALRRPEAYDTLRRYTTLRDTILSQQRFEAVATAQARFDRAGQQARIRVLRQQRRISQLRAAQAAGRARQYALAAGGLLLLLLGGGALLGLLLRSRRRLQASEAALRRANATQQQLMHIIGHDLRGPVAMFQQITPLLQAAVAPAASADADDLVRALDSSAQQLGALVDNLFDWARMQGGQLRYAPQRLRAATAVLSVGQLYEPVARRKGVALELVADEHLLVWADLDLLTTVLRNLLANAIKFTPAGGRVRLAAESTADAGVAFSVADTGGGMSAAALAAVFGAGPVASVPGTAGEPGTGLGLRLCQHFAGLLGTKLHAEAPATGGMRFWLLLPKFAVAG